ncbi:tetratricopeptide repeat protein [Leptodesmis sichuanensis]|uniref:tetratricopeptide repeat protein n=1 Tax=Leptodesmis sichuanensis TaxID=2906798 RepID=UPI001F295428|nr:tetratricopeptide repeat protein [Leptodesmis sichuanensis]UIE36750.1 tetratricopeptide repeat protein [Leptodesmis sichuanensis A121]
MQRLLKQQVANLQQNWHRILLTMSLLLTLLSFSLPTAAWATPGAPPAPDPDAFQQGVEATMAGKYPEALDAFTKAIQMRTQTAAAYANRCLVEVLLNQPAAAIEDCTQALQRQPANGEAYLNRGLAHYYLEHYQSAIEDATHVLQLQPHDFRAYFNRGLAWTGLGHYFAAIQDFDRALQLNPDIPEAYRDRALAYYSAGNTQQALIDLQQAAQDFRQQGNTSAYQQALNLIRQIQQAQAAEVVIG